MGLAGSIEVGQDDAMEWVAMLSAECVQSQQFMIVSTGSLSLPSDAPMVMSGLWFSHSLLREIVQSDRIEIL
jgi:hypothetical protein